MIDLNADLGEGMGNDDALLGIVTSANIACGGHAGDRAMMQRALAAATGAGVAVGAHPSYPDPDGFGRRRMEISENALIASLTEQVGSLVQEARAEGTRVQYIKPHGALYHAVLEDQRHASALVGAARVHHLPLLLAPQAATSRIGALARDHEIGVFAEGFADRGYDPNGLLLPRGAPGALLTDPMVAVGQAVDLAHGRVRTSTGQRVPITVRSVCIHGDTPGALNLARSVREGLQRANVPLAAWTGQ